MINEEELEYYKKIINAEAKKLNSLATKIERLEKILLAGNNTLYFNFNDISSQKTDNLVYFLIDLVRYFDRTTKRIRKIFGCLNRYNYEVTYEEALAGKLYSYLIDINKLTEDYWSYQKLIGDLVENHCIEKKNIPETDRAYLVLYR